MSYNSIMKNTVKGKVILKDINNVSLKGEVPRMAFKQFLEIMNI